MSAKRNDKEKGVITALIIAFKGSDIPPTRQEIEDRAIALAPLLGYHGDLDDIVTEVETIIPSRMKAGESLIDLDAMHDQGWIRKRNMATTYVDAYAEYLQGENWHPVIINTVLNIDGSKILGLLQDPTSEGSWNRRGLVIGHVQSGKTANYLGVIAKAADAGYKFIIVIAGIQNNLRKQTQERVDEGFIGRSSDPASRAPIGVGMTVDYPQPVTLTNINDDFNENAASRMGWKLNDFSKPIILVIKKNVRILDALYNWLKAMNARGDGRISDVPMLMIDDEADNASINTNEDDIKPTRTNAGIRGILGLFTKSCYIGYTATPFANIFINPEAYDEEAREELFPKDFIYLLDAPNTYFGPEKVFVDGGTSEQIVRRVGDCEDYLPFKHKKEHIVGEIPPSLYHAVNQFVVVRAIRNIRGQQRKHCSMLINVSRFVAVQGQVRGFIELYIGRLRSAVKANYRMPDSVSDQDSYMKDLKVAFNMEFATGDHTWEEVKEALWGVFENLRVFLINSQSDEVLDYRKYEQEGVGLTAIAIGGLSLSRGLTLEGLTISYMYRNTRMYDTLMQMGRWFGYRHGYEDLCRVHLPQSSIDWYSYIANASEELRQQVREMRRDGLSPRQFGLYVRSHPDSLLITAANKMRRGEKITIQQNLTGKLKESTLLTFDDDMNFFNEGLIQEHWKGQFGGVIQATNKGWFVPDVDVKVIEEFLWQFKSHNDAVFMKKAVMDYLIAISKEYPKGDVLLVSLGDGDGSDFRLGAQSRNAEGATRDEWRLSRHRLASRGDEKLGLTQPQLEEAMSIAQKKEPTDRDYRAVRRKPLLMLHVLEPRQNEQFSNKRVPAWGMSFPEGLYHIEIAVVANKTWIERMYGVLDDDPSEDEE